MYINADLLQWFINFLIKRLEVEKLKMRIFQNKELSEEVKKSMIRKVKKRKSHSFL